MVSIPTSVLAGPDRLSPIGHAVGSDISSSDEGLSHGAYGPGAGALSTEHADIGPLERTITRALGEVGIALWRELATRLEAALRMLDAGTENWTAFAERFTALCAELGVFEAERICFMSDGAASIRWIRERAFPTAIELLDWYHLVEALRRAIGDERSDRHVWR